jgi:hypothetical protein
MKERRTTADRRIKPPKQGLPAYYTRHICERRQHPALAEAAGLEDGSSDVASGKMTEKPVE